MSAITNRPRGFHNPSKAHDNYTNALSVPPTIHYLKIRNRIPSIKKPPRTPDPSKSRKIHFQQASGCSDRLLQMKHTLLRMYDGSANKPHPSNSPYHINCTTGRPHHTRRPSPRKKITATRKFHKKAKTIKNHQKPPKTYNYQGGRLR